MPTLVTCACGARFQAADHLHGQRVACPMCGVPLDVPQASTDILSSPTPNPPQAVSCRCGQRFRAPPHLAGQSLPCPSCGNPIAIPSIGYAATKPHASNAAALPSGQSQKTWVIGLAAGIGAAIAILVAVLIAFGFFRSPADEMAERSELAPAFDGLASAPQPQPRHVKPQAAPSPPENNVVSPPTAGDCISPASASPSPQASGSLPPDNPPNAGSQVPQTDDNPPQTAGSSATPPVKQNILPSAFTKWHGEAQQPLRGMRRTSGSEDSALMVNYSWMTELLPYLGYQAVYDEFDFNQSWTTRGNLPAAATLILQFLNPLDDRRQWKGYPYDGMPLTHFVGMSGLEPSRNDVAARFPRSDPRAGVFGYDHVARAAEISDGTSHTIAIIGSGEIVAPWVQAGGATIRGAREPYFDRLTGFGTRKLPRSGAVTVFADGSVHAIAADIDPEVFRALCTINGAETINLSNLAP